MSLEITLYYPGHDPAEVELEADYVSFVNSSTYGPPPLIAPSPRKDTEGIRAAVNEEVLYINTTLVPAFKIQRLED